jgi:hypothetical protein
MFGRLGVKFGMSVPMIAISHRAKPCKEQQVLCIHRRSDTQHQANNELTGIGTTPGRTHIEDLVSYKPADCAKSKDEKTTIKNRPQPKP